MTECSCWGSDNDFDFLLAIFVNILVNSQHPEVSLRSKDAQTMRPCIGYDLMVIDYVFDEYLVFDHCELLILFGDTWPLFLVILCYSAGSL